MKAASIPPELEEEIQRLHLSGMTQQQIVDWLWVTHQIKTTRQSLMRCLDRIAARGPAARGVLPQDPGPDPTQRQGSAPGEPAPPRAGAPTATPSDKELLAFWQKKVHNEAIAAEKAMDGDDADWKRYHSALRLIPAYDQALDRKRIVDLEAQGQSQGDTLTPEQEAAATEAARQRMVGVYELLPPESLPPPVAGVGLNEGGGMAN